MRISILLGHSRNCYGDHYLSPSPLKGGYWATRCISSLPREGIPTLCKFGLHFFSGTPFGYTHCTHDGNTPKRVVCPLKPNILHTNTNYRHSPVKGGYWGCALNQFAPRLRVYPLCARLANIVINRTYFRKHPP